jgi:hypothetical protein
LKNGSDKTTVQGIFMKLARIAFASMSIALGTLASSPASADHAHASFGFFVGGPVWYPYPYYPYPYPYPPVVVRPAPQTAYIEQGGEEDPQSYWYYCAESKTYYPYVKECPGGWQRVVPQATPSR